MTDLPIRSRADAVEKLDWYAMRWKIENLSQDPQERLQGRGVQASNGPEAGKPDRDAVHTKLAHILADHAQPRGSRQQTGPGLHEN